MTVVVMTPIGRAALRAREGERLTAYRDSVGIWTIGVGITSASGLIKVTPGLRITAAQSDDLFSKALKQYVAPVAEIGVALTEHQADALVSLCFNIGTAAFRRSSVVRRLRAGDIDGAAEAILMWNRPVEIVPRRQGEYDQFRTPYHVSRPFARRGDRSPVSAPEFVPIATAGPVFAPAARNGGSPALPAPLPPLASPTSPAVVTGGLWSALKGLFSKKGAA